MSLIPDELKVQQFPFPNCKQIISSEMDVCRFCSSPISEADCSEAIHREVVDKSNARIKSHKNLMAIGTVFFVCGIGLVLMPILESFLGYPMVNVSCLIPIILIGGVVAFVKGYLGYREETQRI